MKTILAAAAALTCLATAASAEPWTDYTPDKGGYVKTMIHVEPGHIDDYLSQVIKKVWIPAQESAKRHGVIDSYLVQIKADPYGDGPNVALIVHYPTMTAYDPDKARDEMLDKEFRAIQPKEADATASAERSKYRKILAEELWTSVEFGK